MWTRVAEDLASKHILTEGNECFTARSSATSVKISPFVFQRHTRMLFLHINTQIRQENTKICCEILSKTDNLICILTNVLCLCTASLCFCIKGISLIIT